MYLFERYWTDEHRKKLLLATSFEELADLGEEILHRMPNPVTEVCSPLTTGGRGSFRENVHVYEYVSCRLTSLKHNVFRIMPFENGMQRLRTAWHLTHGDDAYCMPILEVFYKRIFDSGKVRWAYFIPGWESSFGARWERDYCMRIGVQIIDLEEEFIANCEYLTVRRYA